MNINKAFLILAFNCLGLLVASSCQQRIEATANGGQPDSLSMARKAANEQTLTSLEVKKEAAEQRAAAARLKLKEAQEDEADASDAAKQANRAYKTEEKAQRARNEANEQSKRSEKASDKSQQN